MQITVDNVSIPVNVQSDIADIQTKIITFVSELDNTAVNNKDIKDVMESMRVTLIVLSVMLLLTFLGSGSERSSWKEKLRMVLLNFSSLTVVTKIIYLTSCGTKMSHGSYQVLQRTILFKYGKCMRAFTAMMKNCRLMDLEYGHSVQMFIGILNALFEVGKHNVVLSIVDRILRGNPTDLTDELKDFVGEGLRKEGKEEELTKLIEDIKREKVEAAAKAAEEAERAKVSTREVVNALLNTPRLFGKKEPEDQSTNSTQNSAEATVDATTIKEETAKC